MSSAVEVPATSLAAAEVRTPGRRAWVALGCLWFIYLLKFLDRQLLSILANQIARALNTAVIEGKVLELEIAYLDALRTELRAHMFTLREAFEGNLAYWAAEP